MKFNTFNRLGFKLKKYSPEIFLYSGIAGVLCGTVLACKATTKIQPIIDEHNKKLKFIEDAENAGKVSSETYTEKDATKDTVKAYTKTALNLGKLYLPSTAVMSASISCILGSHRILSGRNAALTAAYATLDQAYKRYRNEIIEKYGDDTDKELRFGLKAEKQKDGDHKVYKTTAKTQEIPSNYARFFDETNDCWEDNPEYNLMFLKQRQNWANDRLKAKGYLFLNEVYESLGIPETKAGNIVGWYYDPDDTNRDNFVDFGIYDVKNSAKRDFVNGNEKAILLDFNVDGNVLDLMK